MTRKFAALAALWLCLSAGIANASCLVLPNTLLNGTVADASLVMGNFNAIATCINAPGSLFGNQTANKIYSGPASGGAASPTFRSLVQADMPAYATASATPVDPSGTGNVVGKMMGLASIVTPTASGKVLIIESGLLSNDTINDGASVTLRFGTGAPPANQDPPSGTVIGNNPQMTALANSEVKPYTIAWTLTGLAVGVPIWVDVGLAAIAGGVAKTTNNGFTAVEMP